METSENGRFGHHPDPAIDFCIEVEEIEAIWTDRCNKFANPDDGDLDGRVGRALGFRVGGDLHAINAKDRLRRIESDLVEQAIEVADRIRAAALALFEACTLAEWGNYDMQVDLRSCPVCAGSERTGHTGDCKLRAAILSATGSPQTISTGSTVE